MMQANGDFETRSAVDLTKTGVAVYAADPSTDVWCFAWSIGEEEPEVWTPDRPGNIQRLFDHLAAGGEFHAWNAAFERAIWARIMVKRYGWPELPLRQVRCTMARSLALALPGGLDNAAVALRMTFGKDAEGAKVMKQLMRPKAKTRKQKAQEAEQGFPLPLEWNDTPEKLATLYAYCAQDVRVERAVGKRILPLTELEQAVWELDQKINDRGIPISRRAVRRAMKLVDIAKDRLDVEMQKATGDVVRTCNQVAEIKAWLALPGRGVFLEGLAKAQVSAALADPATPPDARRVLELRQAAARASTSKLTAMDVGSNDDDRARMLHQYHGANTGRWAGRRIQTQNLSRPTLHEDDIPGLLDLLEGRLPVDILPDTFDLLYEAPVLEVLSNCLRGMIATPAGGGRVFRVADFNSVEARGLAWLAGDEVVLDVFRSGENLYCKAAEDVFGYPVNKKKNPFEYSVGKVIILACGYQGAVGAFQAMARAYNVIISDADALKAVKAWRKKNEAIVGYWREVERAAIQAVQHRAKGTVFSAGPIGRQVHFAVRGSFLRCRLPSGRYLSYPFPRLGESVWIRKHTERELPDLEAGEAPPEEQVDEDAAFVSKKIPIEQLKTWERRGWEQNGEPQPTLYYSFEYKRRWISDSTYGGSLVENITQALCRDLLAAAMLRLDARGYELVMHVHDEAVAECDETFGSTKELEAIMCEDPGWAAGFPISAEGFSGRRYKK